MGSSAAIGAHLSRCQAGRAAARSATPAMRAAAAGETPGCIAAACWASINLACNRKCCGQTPYRATSVPQRDSRLEGLVQRAFKLSVHSLQSYRLQGGARTRQASSWVPLLTGSPKAPPLSMPNACCCIADARSSAPSGELIDLQQKQDAELTHHLKILVSLQRKEGIVGSEAARLPRMKAYRRSDLALATPPATIRGSGIACARASSSYRWAPHSAGYADRSLIG